MAGAIAITDDFNEAYPCEDSWAAVFVLPAIVTTVPFMLLLPSVQAFASPFCELSYPVTFICCIPWLRHILRAARFLLFSSDLTAVARFFSMLAIAGLAFNALVQIASGILFDIARHQLGPVFHEDNFVQTMVFVVLAVVGSFYGTCYLVHRIKQQRLLSVSSEIGTSTILFLASILPAASIFVVYLAAEHIPSLAGVIRAVGSSSITYIYYFGLALSYLMTFGGLKLVSADRQASAESKASIRQSTR